MTRHALLATVLRVALALLLVPVPGRAQPAPAAGDSVAVTAPAPAADANELIRNGDYDRAIETLRAAIAREREHPEALRQAYLLLIKTYVFLGNDYKFRPQGREASNLNYRAARELIAECLQIPALRGTQPVPATDYPPEMIAFFTEVRNRMFGGFRVVGLEPATARVVLDGDTLHATGGATAIEATDLPVGTHTVEVRAAGHTSMRETVTISPNATLERRYRLEKRRGAAWYATRAVGALGIVGGAIALMAGGKNDTTPGGPDPLPGAPPPPSP